MIFQQQEDYNECGYSDMQEIDTLRFKNMIPPMCVDFVKFLLIAYSS